MIDDVTPPSHRVRPERKEFQTSCAQCLDQVIGEVVVDRRRRCYLEGVGKRIDKQRGFLCAGALEPLRRRKDKTDPSDRFVVPVLSQTRQSVGEYPPALFPRRVYAIERQWLNRSPRIGYAGDERADQVRAVQAHRWRQVYNRKARETLVYIAAEQINDRPLSPFDR